MQLISNVGFKHEMILALPSSSSHNLRFTHTSKTLQMSVPSKQTASQMITECFLAHRPCVKLHIHLLSNDPESYKTALKIITSGDLFSCVSPASRSRILVALHVTKQHKALEDVLVHCNVLEIVKACEMLDRPRSIRQKIAAIENQNPHLLEYRNVRKHPRKRRKRRYHVLQRRLKQLLDQENESHISLPCLIAHENITVKELFNSASMSGALALKIRKWAQRLPSDFLEFILMSGSLELWKMLADLVHFTPQDFSLPFFLSTVHGTPVPQDTFVHSMRTLMKAPKELLANEFAILAQDYPQVYKSYKFLRTYPRLLEEQKITTLLAQNIPLGTAVWYMEELCGIARPSFDTDIPVPGNFKEEEEQLRRALGESLGQTLDNAQPNMAVAQVLVERIKAKQGWIEDDQCKVSTSFGKLVERMLQARRISDELAKAMIPAATHRLEALKEAAFSKGTCRTAIFGDASESMQIAIESATIFAAMASVCLGGELCFFSDRYIKSPHTRPSSVEQIMDVLANVEAKNCTSIASALWHYYDLRIMLDRIVLVTDEWENESCHGFLFANLLQKYKSEVSPDVELILVGVGAGSIDFQESLRRQDISFKRIEIDERRPDLTKFDGLLRKTLLLSTGAHDEAIQRDFVIVPEEVSELN